MTEKELNEPFFIYEHQGGTAQPATAVDANGVESDFISVNFQRPDSDSSFGEIKVENYLPQCSAHTEDVKELDKTCSIVIHKGLVVEEDGDTVVCDEDEEETVDENQFTYNISRNRPDSEGISILSFNKN